MKKYNFNTNTVVNLDYPKGTHTFDNSADIEYKFNSTDVQITINDYYFCAEDIDELINFLKAVREEVANLK